MDRWFPIFGTIIGALAAWALSEISQVFAFRRKARQRMDTAAFVCLDRLLKIKSAHDRGDAKQQDGEIWHLGGDLDRYRDAIAACPGRRKPHWVLYRRTIPLLLEHDLGILDELIARYEAYADVVQ